MGIPLSKSLGRTNGKLKLKENNAGKARSYHQVDNYPGNFQHSDTCNTALGDSSLNRNDIIKRHLVSESKPNLVISGNGGPFLSINKSQNPSEHRNLKFPSLTLLKSPVYRPDFGHRRINTTPNVADTVDKFVQAGVGYAFLRDSETNTFRPIFPYNYGINSQIIRSQAERNEERSTGCSKIQRKIPNSKEKKEVAKVLNCIAKIASNSGNSKCHPGRPSKGRFSRSITEFNLPLKFRFFLKEREDIDKMLKDPEDRRIRTICERFQCDLDVYDKKIIAGYLQYVVDISAYRSSSLLGCARNLDSALGWNITPQLISSNLLLKKSSLV